MSALVDRRPVEWRGVKLDWARLVALAGPRLVIVEGRDVLLALELSNSRARVTHVQRLRWSPQAMTLSPSGRFALFSSALGNYATLWDLEAGQGVFELAGPESVAAAIARFGEEELLLCSREPGVLEAISLPSVQPLFRVELEKTKPFVFSSIFPLSDGTVCVSGHRYLEMNDQHARFSLHDAFFEPAKIARTLEAPPAIEGTRIVHGASLAAERLTLVERDETNATVYLGDRVHALDTATDHLALMATSSTLVVGRKTAVQLLERRDLSSAPEVVRVRAHALDAARRQLALITPKGSVELCEVAA